MVFGLFFGDVEQKKVFKLVSRFLLTLERFRNVNERIRSSALDGHPGVDDVGFAFSLGCISGSWIGGVRDKFFKSQRYID